MSDQRTEQEPIHCYHKVSFYKYVNSHPIFLAGQYIEEHLLKKPETLKYLAESHFQFNNFKIINIRIERTPKLVETNYNHLEIDPLEVIL